MRQNAMKALRREVCWLEREYSRTVDRKKQQLQWREVAEALGCDAEWEASEELVEQYMQLSITQQQLCQENQELALMASKHAKFQLKAQHMLDSKPELTLASPSIPANVDDGTIREVLCDGDGARNVLRSQGLCYSPSPVNEVALEPLTVPECHQIALHAYREARAFLNSDDYLTSGLEIFGWREQRREAPDHVKFTLKKRFPGVTPMKMSARGWRVVSSSRCLTELYSSTMHLSMKVMQVVDDYNVIMYRVITNTSTRATVQSLFLVTRFQVDNGYVILFRSVDRNRLRVIHSDGTVGPHEAQSGGGAEVKWLDMFTWTLFDDDPDDDNAVRFSYGGIVYGTEAAGTRVWMLEILSLALRWENKVMGPTLMLS
uniref:START domain-containing protein n=1 Tax=Hyaloperonospora arabidopsidis (strain Emoy2) TaxID=559515 RepID=M4BQW9_HYAAE